MAENHLLPWLSGAQRERWTGWRLECISCRITARQAAPVRPRMCGPGPHFLGLPRIGACPQLQSETNPDFCPLNVRGLSREQASDATHLAVLWPLLELLETLERTVQIHSGYSPIQCPPFHPEGLPLLPIIPVTEPRNLRPPERASIADELSWLGTERQPHEPRPESELADLPLINRGLGRGPKSSMTPD
jgi:hypothetical protein